MDALLDMDPSRLAGLGGIPLEERLRADDGIVQVLLARSDHDDRRGELWEILASTEFQRRGLDWGGIWAALSDEQRDRVVELYDAVPEQLLPFVDGYRSQGEVKR